MCPNINYQLHYFETNYALFVAYGFKKRIAILMFRPVKVNHFV